MKPYVHFLLIIAVMIFTNTTAFAGPTMVSGNVSGTWDLAGSPYIVTDECTVPTSTLLTIEPGVEIIIGEGRTFNVYGQIIAVGTETQQITFRAPNDEVKFAKIYVSNGSNYPPISKFEHCNFRNGEIGLYIHTYARIVNDWTTMQTDIKKCHFEGNGIAIYAWAQAVDRSQYMTPKRCHARVNPVIKESFFKLNDTGIELIATGVRGNYYSGAEANAIIINNVFLDLSATALKISSGDLNGGATTFINNSIVSCDRGVHIGDPDLDVLMKNNLFYEISTAIERVGSLSGAYFNCFFNNTTNFVGYPSSYGDIVMTNANGDPCDIGYNIFLDPMLVENDFHITEDSPCIDGGTSDDAPDIDIDGDSRPQLYAIDIGADEFYKKELFAKAGPDLTVCTLLCDDVTLNGSKSYALSSTIDFYDWTLLHRTDSMYDQTATGSTPVITNLGLGVYDVALTVTDDVGIQATDLMVLTVKNDCDPCSVMKGDLDSDGDVDGNDLTIFSHYFGTSPAVSED